MDHISLSRSKGSFADSPPGQPSIPEQPSTPKAATLLQAGLCLLTAHVERLQSCAAGAEPRENWPAAQEEQSSGRTRQKGISLGENNIFIKCFKSFGGGKWEGGERRASVCVRERATTGASLPTEKKPSQFLRFWRALRHWKLKQCSQNVVGKSGLH